MCKITMRLTESEDYSVTDIFVRNPAGGPQSMKDAAVSIDRAKEICIRYGKKKLEKLLDFCSP